MDVSIFQENEHHVEAGSRAPIINIYVLVIFEKHIRKEAMIGGAHNKCAYLS